MLLDIDHFASMNEVAKVRGVQPSTVSKGVRRLEAQLGRRLVARSARGATLTRAGQDLVRSVAPLVRALEDWERGGATEDAREVLTVGAPSAVATHLLPPVHATLREEFPDVFVRIIDLRQTESLSAGLSGQFQMVYHWEALDWPNSWYEQQIGELPWRLYVRKTHPLGPGPNAPEDLDAYRFIAPAYWYRNEFQSGGDGFAEYERARRWGDETVTAEAALHLVEQSDQIAFLPDLVAARPSGEGRIRALEVAGHSVVRRPLYVTVKSDEVQMPLFRKLCELLKEALEAGAA